MCGYADPLALAALKSRAQATEFMPARKLRLCECTRGCLGPNCPALHNLQPDRGSRRALSQGSQDSSMPFERLKPDPQSEPNGSRYHHW